ncbi:MAG: hypothetical protein K5776_11085 [Lachnospiraceae bacterium]|nr:hypothetical protein [Lachnospiraceae bacterium]
MHIAVLDDNIADRKHLERLLDRESDRRIQTTGNLYIDSYGATETMLNAPLKQYDFFMIDMKGPVGQSLDIIKSLREKSVNVPVCLMRNENEVTNKEEFGELLFIEKPIIVAKLSELVGKAIEIRKNMPEDEEEEETTEYTEKKGFFKSLLEKFY